MEDLSSLSKISLSERSVRLGNADSRLLAAASLGDLPAIPVALGQGATMIDAALKVVRCRTSNSTLSRRTARG